MERGDVVIAVDGRAATAIYREAVAQQAASVPAMAESIAGRKMFAGPSDSVMTLEVEGRGTVTVGRGLCLESSPPEARFGTIGYINVPSFALIALDVLDRTLAEMADTEGLILDLRGNGGGSLSLAHEVLGRFFSRELAEFRLVHASGEVEGIRPEPLQDAYGGRLAVLVDETTFSAANYVAQRIRWHDRGVLVGRHTGGGAAGSFDRGTRAARGEYPLLSDVDLQIAVFKLIAPDGTDAETGLSPDVAIPLTVEYLRASRDSARGVPERDPVLQRALDVLREEP